MTIKRVRVKHLVIENDESYSGLTVFAVVFIRAIGTVSEAVALPAAMDTAAIVTLKLVRATGARSCRGEWKNRAESHLIGYTVQESRPLTACPKHTNTHHTHIQPYLLGIPTVLALGQKQ